MDLSTPMINEQQTNYLDNLLEEDIPNLNSKMFIQLYNEDKLGGMIRNLETWIKENFEHFLKKNFSNFFEIIF